LQWLPAACTFEKGIPLFFYGPFLFKWYLQETALFCRTAQHDIRHNKLNFAGLPSDLHFGGKELLTH
jgi:hypothetical protein